MINKTTYTQLWTREIKILSLVATLYRHNVSGAEVIHLSNEDTNRCFAIGFQTVPTDSTGIAHILEHSVLAGSQKYPLKDPFATLLKSSQKTFLNAMTYPDRTIYPVASQNEEDFKNLINVYLDAVFHPLLTENTFKQEGWHFELAADSPLIYKGVVYNEMKGAYSNVDGLIEQYMLEAVFPDTQYSNDSGGNPEVIPQLTHEGLVSFHKKNYHPSRARAYFYGKLNIEEYLDFIEPALRCAEVQENQNDVLIQPHFEKPKVIHRDIPAAPDRIEKSGAVVLGWMLTGESSPLLSAQERVAAWLLTAALIDSDASPFKKAILESRLGESLAGIGFEGDVQQPLFYMGLKQVKESDFDAVVALFQSELERLMKNGFEKKFLESIVSKLEFELREMNASGHYPKAVSLYTQMMTSWNYGRDPLESVDIESVLEALKQEIRNETGYFTRLLERFLVSNSHRVTLFLHGNAHLQESLQKKELETLKKIEENYTKEQRDQRIADTIAFHQYQEQGDTPEAVATLPKLQVADLSRTNELVEGTIKRELFETTITPQKTNGITYLDIAFDLGHLFLDEQQYVPILAEYFGRLATAEYTAEALAQEIDSLSGGIDAAFAIRPFFGTQGDITAFFVSAKFLNEKRDLVLALMTEMVQKIDFTDIERMSRILVEEKSEFEEEIVSSGHAYALAHSRAAIHPTFNKAQYFSGVKALRWLQQQNNDSENKEVFAQKCASIWKKIITTPPIIHITSEDSTQKETVEKVNALVKSWSADSGKITAAENALEQLSRSAAFVVPAQISYQGYSLPLQFSEKVTRGSLVVIQKLLNVDYLWKKVRQLGGAYGSGVASDLGAGLMSFYSYRDPNIASTYDIFRETGEYLRTVAETITQREIDDCIIAAIAQMDYPLTPQEKGFDWFMRQLVHYTDEARQIVRTEILQTSREHIRGLGDYMFSVPQKSTAYATIGNRELIEKPENRKLFEVVSDI